MRRDEVKPYLTSLGFPASVIDQRLKLLTLPPQIQQGIVEGKVKPGVAAKIANRSSHDQQAYVERLQNAGKLTGKDVTELRKVQVQSTLAKLPDALFELPEEGPSLRVRRALEAFVAEGVSKETLRSLVEALPEAEVVF